MRDHRHPLAAPLVAAGSVAVALLLLAEAWLRLLERGPGRLDGSTLLLACCLLLAVVATFQWPIHLRPKTKVYMASVPYYLLAALVPPALAATAAGIGALGGELSVQRRRGTTRSSIATEAGRRAVIVWLGAFVAWSPVPTEWHEPALVAAAVVMAAGDIVTYPLVLAPLSGESPWRIITAVARDATLLEGAQYLIGLLGVLMLSTQLWALVLLAAPTFLLYLAMRALRIADQAKHVAEEAVRIRDDFLLSASHDLRTPLAVVLGRAASLDRMLTSGRPLEAESLRRQVEALQRAAKRMHRTVEDWSRCPGSQAPSRPCRLRPRDSIPTCAR